MNHPNRGGCDDDEVPGDVRKATGFRFTPTALTVIRVENGWVITVFFADKTKVRHVASSSTEVGGTVRKLLDRADYDWLPEIEKVI
jgi:hypothetical protein